MRPTTLYEQADAQAALVWEYTYASTCDVTAANRAAHAHWNEVFQAQCRALDLATEIVVERGE